MALLLGYGVIGVYILVFGSLARFLLIAPRTIGLEARLFDVFLVASATILAVLLVNFLIERLKQKLGKATRKLLSQRALSTIRSYLLQLAMVSLVLGTSIVIIERISLADRFTPFQMMLFSVSFAGALLVESLKKLIEFRSI